MKVIEERYLKKISKQLNTFVREHRDFLDFYANIDTLAQDSLQKLSIKSDLEFFDEVSLILSIIISIISHPHLLNKTEEIILRAELAPHLTVDMFQQTIRDSKLWTKNGLDMVPENVYYYQNIDELCIYENIFIVKVIRLIELELGKYNDFYTSAIQTVDSEGLSLKSDGVKLAIDMLKKINRKLRHIKNTYFYKVVSKARPIHSVHPTNILLKDRLYNRCYKFYKKMITYSDETSKLNDISFYYFTKLIKVVKEKGFDFSSNKNVKFKFPNRKAAIPHIKLSNEDFDLDIQLAKDKTAIELTVINKHVHSLSARKACHLLLFDIQSSVTEFEIDNQKITEDKYDTIDALSLWNLFTIEEETNPVFTSVMSEYDLISHWFENKVYTTLGNYDLYTTYCPVCKNINIDIDNYCECDRCKSKYVFYSRQSNVDRPMWFLKLRRGK